MLYDTVEVIGEEGWDFKRFEQTIRQKENKAFVFLVSGKIAVSPQTPFSPQYQVVARNSPEFELLEFALNHIRFKANFRTEKFLVYNDGYDRNWQAFVNGRLTRIFQANYAFKGIWLPAGENVVVFRYGPPVLYIFTCFMFALYAAVLAYLIVLGVRHCRGKDD